MPPDYYVGLDQLLDAVPVAPLAAFADGALFRYQPGGSNTDADARRDLRQRYASIADGVPVSTAAAGFNLYLDDTAEPRLATYINEQCASDDTQALFFLNIIPANSVYLIGHERRHGFNMVFCILTYACIHIVCGDNCLYVSIYISNHSQSKPWFFIVNLYQCGSLHLAFII